MSLPTPKLELIFLCYGKDYGRSSEAYARTTFEKWKSGVVQMSGMIAERLLNLVPHILEPAVRFQLVKTLRNAHLYKQHRTVSCLPSDWRKTVAPVIAELLVASQQFQLPQYVLNRVRWLADGDAISAQRLLADAEEEEALVRLQYLESEFKQIDRLIQNIAATKKVTHKIDLPQGTISISIAVPETGFWSWLGKVAS